MLDWLRKNNIENIEFSIVDYAGLSRGKMVEVETLHCDKAQRIPIDAFAQTIEGEYVQVLNEEGKNFNPLDRDVLMMADETTIQPIPWLNRPSASVICDAVYSDGSTVDFAPRQVLKNVLKRYHSKGLTPVVAPELEFYLFKAPVATDDGLQFARGINTAHFIESQPYSVECLNGLGDFFDEVCTACRIQSIHCDTLVKEVAAGQYEINLKHGDALARADEAMRFKRTVRSVAKKHGMQACFMAKIKEKIPGNSMHIHQSLQDESGKNLFSDADGKNTELFRYFIGGLKRYLPEATAILMPYVNSYRRIEPYLCAPLNVQWSQDNRTVGLRIPEPDSKGFDRSRRIENRIPGADCNPYLAFAVTLAAGLQGIEECIDPGAPYAGNAYELPLEFPSNLSSALEKFEGSDTLKMLLGSESIRFFSAIKRAELKSFKTVVTPWEFQHLSGVV